MRKDRRLFGNNLKVLLVEKEITTEEFAQMIGCLGVSVESMYLEREFSEYEKAGCIECRGRFSNPENKKLVLDLLDIYCDVQEIAADEVM